MSSICKRGFIALAACALLQVAQAADISVHEVYEAAQSGHLREAQTMMQQVLRDHPNSAKAHYVDAEILAKAGQLAQARSELAIAEKLEPGLPFASPSAVQALRDRLNPVDSTRKSAASGFPWGLALLGIALLTAIVMFVRAMRQRNAMQAAPLMQSPNGFGPGYGQPYGPNPGYGPNMGPGGGMGGGIMGGLATGAALGAGMVAGQALAHHLMGDGERSGVVPDAQANHAIDTAGVDPNSNMGGNDFGLNDTSSWDNSSSSWDSGGDLGGGGDWS